MIVIHNKMQHIHNMKHRLHIIGVKGTGPAAKATLDRIIRRIQELLRAAAVVIPRATV